MWNAVSQNISMTEGDFGVQLPVTVSGTSLTPADTLRFTFLDAPNGSVILSKSFSAISDNTVNLELAEAESALFTPGTYCYRLDWYQDGAFMCCLIPSATFKVVDKA